MLPSKSFATECASIDASFLQEDASGKLTCPCATCACSCCQIMFKQHDRRKIALPQVQETAGLPSSIETQSTVGFFHGVIDSHLQNTSAAARQESGISQDQASNHAASFASLGIPADPNIQRSCCFIRIYRQHAVPGLGSPRKGCLSPFCNSIKVLLNIAVQRGQKRSYGLHP
jgi:hypothetical protein